MPGFLREASFDLGILTGRKKELADLIKRWRAWITGIQEIIWKGAKSCEMGDGHKLLHSGTLDKRNGEATVVSESFHNKVFLVTTDSGRLIFIQYKFTAKPWMWPSGYVTQTACTKNEKHILVRWFHKHNRKHESILLAADAKTCCPKSRQMRVIVKNTMGMDFAKK